MKDYVRIIIPVSVFIAMLIVVGGIILYTSQSFAPILPDPIDNVIPQHPPSIARNIPSEPMAPCLPTSSQFTSLRTCTKQSDCVSCSESPTSCVVVGGETDSSVDDDGQMTYPVSVNVPIDPANADQPCSGHGQLLNGVCVCDGQWEHGRCIDDVCYSGPNCELGTFNIRKAGQYCLPSYLGKCDEFTSDTVLSNTGAGTTWTCACKQSMAGIFKQSVEGGNCNVQIACGAPIGVTAQVNVGTLHAPVFESGVVYPNRLTSYVDEMQGQEACVYKTSGRTANGIVQGASVDADPTCVPRLYNNTCTINTGGNNTQIIRGSGMPGDPRIERVSPPFYAPVPPGLNSCPDGWFGRGTSDDPCTNPSDGDEQYVFFTSDVVREWIGPDITSAKELREWWVMHGPGTSWTTLENSDVFCLESGAQGSAFATANDATSAFCIDTECTAAEGFRAIAWSGARDGPLLDENALPHWVTGGPYGGQCSCDGKYTGGHTQVAQYALTDRETPDTWWSCAADMCAGTQFPDAKWNNTSKMCDCHASENANSTPPFATGMSYKHPSKPAMCVRDPCNPSGVNVGVNEVSCSSDAQCGGLCSANQCYIPFSDGKTCSADIQCTGSLSGLSNRVAKCVDGTCATLDIVRARMGSTCTEDLHCSLGACTGPVGGTKTCTGGCACASGHHQVSDGGVSPLGMTCVDDCVGKCLNGGICVHLPQEQGGGTECRCTPYFGGDRCETQLCSRYMDYCDSDTPCCSDCPCTQSTNHCCNRFPKEPTPEGYEMSCINNTCQYERTTSMSYQRTNCSAYVWFKKDNTGQYPNDYPSVPIPQPDPNFECSTTGGTCDTHTDCCNACVCENPSDGITERQGCCGPGHDWSRKFTTCEDGVCVEKTNNIVGFPYGNEVCSTTLPNRESSHFYTETPPDCGGWGVRDETGVCVCAPSHTGEECETQVCSLEQQACSIDTECCNACVCDDGTHRAECCGITHSMYTPYTQCKNGTCQRVSVGDFII